MSNQISWSILKHFSSKNIYGFNRQHVAAEFPDKNPVILSRALAHMVSKGMLLKLSRNNYHIVPLSADPATYIPDRHQSSKYFMLNKSYYIGYASAMHIHGIKSISGNTEYVVTAMSMRPNIRSFEGTTFKFILHDTNRFFGFKCVWINLQEKAMVSDLEKTIVDIATKPQYGGGIIALGQAIHQTKDRINLDKLFFYLSRNRNKSAKKRFLYLTDLLDMKWTTEHERMMEELGSGSSLLDPSVSDKGIKRVKFGLRMNVDPILIKSMVLKK